MSDATRIKKIERWCLLLLVGHKRDWKLKRVIAEWWREFNPDTEVDWPTAVAELTDFPLGPHVEHYGGRVGSYLSHSYPQMSAWMLRAWGILGMSNQAVVAAMVVPREIRRPHVREEDKALRAVKDSTRRQEKINRTGAFVRAVAVAQHRRGEQWHVTK